MELEIFNKLVIDCLEQSENLLNISSSVSVLDVSVSLSKLAHYWGYCRPELSDDITFSITSGRHPVVEQTLQNKSDLTFTGNNCHLKFG